MQIKIWGTRGSCPSPMSNSEYQNRLESITEAFFDLCKKNTGNKLPTKKQFLKAIPVHYRNMIGGNTTCVEVVDDSTRLIFDLGTGVRNLGNSIVKAMENKSEERKELHIFVTHTHWDHIQGWPFFVPAYMPQFDIHFYSSLKNLEERLQEQQQDTFFPARLQDMQSNKKFHLLGEEELVKIDAFTVVNTKLIHPGGCTSYKIEQNGKKFIFATDTEFYIGNLKYYIEKYQSYFENADILLMDAQYSVQESIERRGWGHTSMLACIDCALHWKVKKLILTHHEPNHLDKEIWDLYDGAKRYLKKLKSEFKMIIEIAQEGSVHTLE